MGEFVYKFEMTVFKRSDVMQAEKFYDIGAKAVDQAGKKIIKIATSEIESLVINKGLITTFSGVFALVWFCNISKSPILIAYRPSFNYETITNIYKIKEYLKSLKAKVKV